MRAHRSTGGTRVAILIATVLYAGGCGLSLIGGQSDDEKPPSSSSGSSSDGSTTIDAETPGDGSSTIDDGSGGDGPSGDGPKPTTDGGASCPSGRGPTMVLVEISATTRFCIDSTEVTRGQYQTFLDGNPSPAIQSAACSWNLGFAPDPGNPDMTATQLPMVKVDWCDALAFCTWAGKRLCGAINGGGPIRLSNPLSAALDPKQSEWMAVCTRDGTRSFPYGDPFASWKCNGEGGAPTAAGGAYPQCVGGYPGIFDMNGNVTEWENICDTQSGNGAHCFDRGGSAYGAESRCSYASLDKVVDRSSDWGIRCCATPK